MSCARSRVYLHIPDLSVRLNGRPWLSDAPAAAALSVRPAALFLSGGGAQLSSGRRSPHEHLSCDRCTPRSLTQTLIPSCSKVSANSCQSCNRVTLAPPTWYRLTGLSIRLVFVVPSDTINAAELSQQGARCEQSQVLSANKSLMFCPV